MLRKQIKQLTLQSYKGNSLDEEKVKTIANLLSRHQLKQYIKELKSHESKKNVVIHVPFLPKVEDQEKIKQLFFSKKVIYIIEPSLMVGLKVVDNDIVYDFNLKNTLEELASHVITSYD